MTTVQNIVDNAHTLAGTVLPATWKRLRYHVDLLRNSDRDAATAYGIYSAGAEDAGGLINFETLDRTFFLVLSDTIGRYDDDDSIQAVVNTLEDYGDQIFKKYVQTKLSLTSTVLQVKTRSIEAPIVTAAGVVFVRMGFVVQYRQSIL